MIDVSSAQLSNVVLHRVGNKTREEGMRLAENESIVGESLSELLAQNYLSPLSKQKEIYDFFHESDLSLNMVSNIAGKIYLDPSDFVGKTQGLVKHLYATSTH